MIDLVKDGFDAFGAAEVQSVDQGASQSHEIGAACKGFEDDGRGSAIFPFLCRFLKG